MSSMDWSSRTAASARAILVIQPHWSLRQSMGGTMARSAERDDIFACVVSKFASRLDAVGIEVVEMAARLTSLCRDSAWALTGRPLVR